MLSLFIEPEYQGYFIMMLAGAKVTLSISLVSLLVATLFGLWLASLRMIIKNQWLVRALDYLSFLLRGLPELLLMFFFFYGGQILVNMMVDRLFPGSFVSLTPFVAGVLTLGLIYGAYMAETFQAGYQAIPQGALEAAQSLGFSRFILFKNIILPQIICRIMPGFTNNFLVLLKSSALVSVIGLDDLVRKASIAAGVTFEPILFYGAAGLIYLFFSLIASGLLGALNTYSQRRIFA